jgi:hypothetical protein
MPPFHITAAVVDVFAHVVAGERSQCVVVEPPRDKAVVVGVDVGDAPTVATLMRLKPKLRCRSDCS